MTVYLVYYTNDAAYPEDREEFVDMIFLNKDDADNYAAAREFEFMENRDEYSPNSQWFVVEKEVMTSLS
jgi:hypothetical protein